MEVGDGQGVPTFVKDLFSGACGGIAQVLIGELRIFVLCCLSNGRWRGVRRSEVGEMWCKKERDRCGGHLDTLIVDFEYGRT